MLAEALEQAAILSCATFSRRSPSLTAATEVSPSME